MRRPVAPSSMQPYERYEQGFVDYFFDPSSTTDKGRFRVYDARDFLVSTITLSKELRVLFTYQVQLLLCIHLLSRSLLCRSRRACIARTIRAPLWME